LQAEFKKHLQSNTQTLNFVEQLEIILQNMLHVGEIIRSQPAEEGRFDPDYVWTAATRSDLAIDKLLQLARLAVVEKFDDFRGRTNPRYQELAKFLRKHLLNLKCYILSDTYLYVLGPINTKDVAGVLTRVW
jgi:hypothetical protein